MSSSKAPAPAPAPAAPLGLAPKDLTSLKTTYAGWLRDADVTRRKNLTTETSRLAASGLKPGSTMWVTRMEGVEANYQKELETIEGSETKKLIVKEEARLAKEAADAAIVARSKYDVKPDVAESARNAKINAEYSKYIKGTGTRDAVSRGEFGNLYTGRDAMSFSSRSASMWSTGNRDYNR